MHRKYQLDEVNPTKIKHIPSMMSNPCILTYASAYIGSEKPIGNDQICVKLNKNKWCTSKLRNATQVGDEIFPNLSTTSCPSNILIILSIVCVNDLV